MDKNALKFLSRFSLPPNALGYCGENSAPAKLIKCITTGVCQGIEKEITKFIVLYPYLKFLSRVTGFSPFSLAVIEAYWLGNEELKKIKAGGYDLLLNYFTEQGVPQFLIEELKGKKPKVFIPTHLFQVLHVGVGRASGSVPYNLESINQCMIRWGGVKKISKTKITVDLHSLIKKNNRFKLIIKEEVLPLKTELVPEIKISDSVAIHWQQLVKILTTDEEKKLEYWTKEVINSLT